MTIQRLASIALAMGVLLMVFAPAASAFTYRTYVSAYGSDANAPSDCPRSNPCRYFAAAIPRTFAGGEVVAVDSGVFATGPITLTTAMTLSAIPGEIAQIPVNSSTTAVTVNAPAAAMVSLRNLQFLGAGSTSSVGVQLNSGKLVIENSLFTDLTWGVSIVGKADIIDSNFKNNTLAVRAVGEGTNTGGSFPWVATQTSVRIAGGNYLNNTFAFQMVNPGFRPAPSTETTPNILVMTYGGGTDWIANATGNGTLASGSGTGCPAPVPPSTNQPCTALGTYHGSYNPK